MKRPQALDDLYRDLRDRRLLPIVALLVVAIIAVPIVLSVSSGGSTATAPPVAEIVPADAPEAQAAVLAENPGLRDYRERLDDLKASNPFKQQFQVGIAAGSGGGGQASGTSGSSSVPSGDATSAPSSGTGTSAGSTSFDTSSTSATTFDINDSGSSGTSNPKPQLYTFRADLQYGVDGDVKQRKNVKLLDLLSPVGAFIGASEDGSRAYFALSTDVTAVDGDGTCAPPDPTSCDFLALKEGESATLIYQTVTAETATVYRLGVDEIRLVKVKKPPTPSN